MRPASYVCVLSLLGALLVAPPSALGQPSADGKAAAEALYDEAQQLLSAGKYDQALDKLLASQRLDPALGTLLNIAFCYEKIGKTASAWASYSEVAAKATGDKQGRGERAAAAAKALEPKLARVVVAVPAPSRVDKLEVRRDGAVVEGGGWDTPIPADPGSHVFEASAPGRVAWKSTVVVPAGPSSTTVTVPALAVAPVAEAPPAASAWSGRRIAGVTVAGVGVLSAIAGGVFGGLAIAKKGAEGPHCHLDDPHLCDATGVSLQADGVTMANVSNVTFAIGGAAIVTGAVLYLTAPKAGPASSGLELRIAPAVALETQGATISGRW